MANPKQQLELLPSDVHLSRRKHPKHAQNPFIDDQLITQLSGTKNVFYTQTTRNAIVDMATQEATPATLQVVKKIRADKENFVKLYTTHLKAFFELTTTAYKVLQYVLHTVQTESINEDKVYLSISKSKKFFDEQGSSISPASYYRAMKDLVEKLFLAESEEAYIYFINPQLFFNGDRIEFITKFYLKSESDVKTIKREDLPAAIEHKNTDAEPTTNPT